MLLSQPLEVLILLIPTILFALSFHEFSHAWMAYRLGDDTAARMGRLTLNPLAHLDPFGSLMILFVGFGWAKPVPVNPYNLGNPRTDMMKVAFAGPASNLLLALISGILFRLIDVIGITVSQSVISLLFLFTYINIMLALFNMFPIPPLDGSQIFSGFMSKYNPDLVHKLHLYGPRILFGVIIFSIITRIPVFGTIMSPFLKVLIYLFAGISLN